MLRCTQPLIRFGSIHANHHHNQQQQQQVNFKLGSGVNDDAVDLIKMALGEGEVRQIGLEMFICFPSFATSSEPSSQSG